MPWRRERLPTPVFLGFPGGSAGRESTCNVGDLGSIPGWGRSPGEGKGYPRQYSDLENPKGLARVGHNWATFTFTYNWKSMKPQYSRELFLDVKTPETPRLDRLWQERKWMYWERKRFMEGLTLSLSSCLRSVQPTHCEYEFLSVNVNRHWVSLSTPTWKDLMLLFCTDTQYFTVWLIRVCPASPV